MTRAYLTIEGPWARMSGVPDEVRDEVLRVMDPDAKRKLAYREKRWDGMIDLFTGGRYPSGLTLRLYQRLEQDPDIVEVVVRNEHAPMGSVHLREDYLPGVTLWPWQMEGCGSMLNSPCGAVKVPTSGGKTLMEAVIAKYAFEHYGLKTLVLTSKRGILDQMVRVFNAVLGDVMSVGQMGDGEHTVGDVTLGTAQTLIGYTPRRRRVRVPGTKRYKQQFIKADPVIRQLLREAGVLLLDEAHHTSAETWYEIAMACQAKYRYGLSGTPLKFEDYADARMIGATGPVIYDIEADVLIAAGKSARPKIVIVSADAASEPEMEHRAFSRLRSGKLVPGTRWPDYKKAYRYAIVESDVHNRAVIRATEWLVDRNRRTLILTRQKDQWRLLRDLLEESGLSYAALWGDTATPERHSAKVAMDESKLQVILASVIFDEGEDVPGIDAMVLAEGVKSNTNAVQRIGRGMRREEGGYEDVWIVDFAPTSHPVCLEHGADRCASWEAEGYEVMVWDQWPDTEAEGAGEMLLPFEQWDAMYAATREG